MAAAVQDGTFAVAVGEIARHYVGDSDDLLRPATGGVAADLLLSETASRLNAIASLPFLLSPYRDHLVAARGAAPTTLSANQQEIVAVATGRRTARDIAFALGRHLYPVMVEVSQMLAGGLLEIASPETSSSFTQWGLASLRPRAAPGQPAHSGADQASSLPARHPGQATPEFRNRPRPSEVEC